MRDMASGAADLFRAPHRRERERVLLEDGSGTMVDVTAWVVSWSVTVDVDQQARQADVALWREAGGESLAPLMSMSPGADIERRLVIQTAMVPVGDAITEADWLTHFDEITDDVSWASLTVMLDARGPWGRLYDEWVTTEFVTSAGPVQGAMQALIDEVLGENEVTVYTTGEPDQGATSTTWAQIRLAEALESLADLNGWDLRYMWDDSEDEFRLQFFEPPDPETPSFGFGPDDYFEVGDIGLYTTQRRRRVFLTWDGGEVEVIDATWEEGDRLTTTFLDAVGDTGIATQDQANALANAAGRAVFLPPLRKTIQGRHFPWVQLHDLFRWDANLVHYLEDQEMAVTRYRHFRPEQGPIQTEMSLFQRPHGAVGRWFVRAARDEERRRLRREPEDEPPPLPEAGDSSFYYTTTEGTQGFSESSDKEGSLGKYISTTRVTDFDALNVLRAVTQEEVDGGETFYVCLAFANTHPTLATPPLRAYVPDPGVDADAQWHIGLDPAGIVGLFSSAAQGEEIADTLTAPTGVTFAAPDNVRDGLVIGKVPPESAIFVWHRLTVTASPSAPETGGASRIALCLPYDPDPES